MLERRPARGQGQVEGGARAGEVLAQLRQRRGAALAVGDGSILVQDEPGFVRSDRLLRLGLPLATLLGVIVLGLAATAVWMVE